MLILIYQNTVTHHCVRLEENNLAYRSFHCLNLSNTTEVLMLHTKLKIMQERTAQVNKTVLEAEKARDEFHNQLE